MLKETLLRELKQQQYMEIERLKPVVNEIISGFIEEKIDHIDFSNYMVGDEVVNPLLILILNLAKNISSFNFKNCGLRKGTLLTLADNIEKYKEKYKDLKLLDLSNNYLMTEPLNDLLKKLHSNNSMETINLSSSWKSDFKIDVLISLINESQKIQNLDLKENLINKFSFCNLLQTIRNKESISLVDLSDTIFEINEKLGYFVIEKNSESKKVIHSSTPLLELEKMDIDIRGYDFIYIFPYPKVHSPRSSEVKYYTTLGLF